MILDGKRILVTGVLNRHSIAYAIAERAKEKGAQVLSGKLVNEVIHPFYVFKIVTPEDRVVAVAVDALTGEARIVDHDRAKRDRRGKVRCENSDSDSDGDSDDGDSDDGDSDDGDSDDGDSDDD